jgi:hypothetical protein
MFASTIETDVSFEPVIGAPIVHAYAWNRVINANQQKLTKVMCS